MIFPYVRKARVAVRTTRQPRRVLRYGRVADHAEGRSMAKKKKIFLLLAAISGLFAAKKMKARKDEQDLWTEATDTADLR